MPDKNFTPLSSSISKKTIGTQFGSLTKEIEPLINFENIKVQEMVEHREIDEDVKPYVKVRHETIKLPSDLKEAGAEIIPSTQFPSYQDIKLPGNMSNSDVLLGSTKPIYSSFRWLAELCKYILHQAHLTIKEIGGKAVRVKEES